MTQENVATAYLHEQAKAHLLAFVERVERLEEEKKALAADISEVMKEAKGNGFCTKTIKKIIALRKKEEHERMEEEALMLTYMAALNMIPQLADLPLGQASINAPTGSQEKAQEAAKAETATQLAQGLETAALEGRQAGRAGSKVTENPYLYNDPRHGKWEDGWKSTAKELVAA
jgi:uncharacterized protein (UPF0335 family)/ribosome modulation factor